MPTTIGCSFGDVILVPFPFTDQTTTKKRPAIVVSSDAYHRERSDLGSTDLDTLRNVLRTILGS